MAYQNPEIAELRAQQEALDKQLAEAKERETRYAVMEIVQKMREYGISLGELIGDKPAVRPLRSTPAESASVPATGASAGTVKYRDPASGATWSGRGRAPAWITGKDRNDFLVDRNEAAPEMVQAALFPEDH
jgi:DNA-binding protein H-NS